MMVRLHARSGYTYETRQDRKNRQNLTLTYAGM